MTSRAAGPVGLPRRVFGWTVAILLPPKLVLGWWYPFNPWVREHSGIRMFLELPAYLGLAFVWELLAPDLPVPHPDSLVVVWMISSAQVTVLALGVSALAGLGLAVRSGMLRPMGAMPEDDEA